MLGQQCRIASCLACRTLLDNWEGLSNRILLLTALKRKSLTVVHQELLDEVDCQDEISSSESNAFVFVKDTYHE
jgi:hypothetical protein